jgi:hypothetical protein
MVNRIGKFNALPRRRAKRRAKPTVLGLATGPTAGLKACATHYVLLFVGAPDRADIPPERRIVRRYGACKEIP